MWNTPHWQPWKLRNCWNISFQFVLGWKAEKQCFSTHHSENSVYSHSPVLHDILLKNWFIRCLKSCSLRLKHCDVKHWKISCMTYFIWLGISEEHQTFLESDLLAIKFFRSLKYWWHLNSFSIWCVHSTLSCMMDISNVIMVNRWHICNG